MLDTFKARLKAKSTAAGANLSTKRIDALADRLNKKFPDPKDEAEHDTAIDSLYDATDLKEFAQVDDYQRTKAAKEAKEAKEKEEADKKASEAAGGKSDDEPSWFKKYREDNDAKLNGLLQEKQQQTMQQKLSSHEKLKGIDAKLYSKWQLPKTEEEIESFADEVVGTYGHLIPKEAGETTQNSFMPGQTRSTATGSKKVDAGIVKFAQQQNEKAKSATQNTNNSIISN